MTHAVEAEIAAAPVRHHPDRQAMANSAQPISNAQGTAGWSPCTHCKMKLSDASSVEIQNGGGGFLVFFASEVSFSARRSPSSSGKHSLWITSATRTCLTTTSPIPFHVDRVSAKWSTIPVKTKMRTASQRKPGPLQTESWTASSGITGPSRPESAPNPDFKFV